MSKTYKLLGPNGTYMSEVKGLLGGNKGTKVYGRMDCPTALRYLKKGTYQKNRVFFADKDTAIATGYRPCHSCMKEEYKRWKAGGTPGTEAYPWTRTPKNK